MPETGCHKMSTGMHPNLLIVSLALPFYRRECWSRTTNMAGIIDIIRNFTIFIEASMPSSPFWALFSPEKMRDDGETKKRKRKKKEWKRKRERKKGKKNK